MNLDFIQQVCEKLPGVTTDIKWGADLVFSVAEKMFCVCSTDPPLRVSFKVPDDEFEEISVRDGFQPAPYMARAKWVLVDQPSKLNREEWRQFMEQSYELVKAKLSKKMQDQLLRSKVQGTRNKAQAKVQGARSKKVQGTRPKKVQSTRTKKAQEESTRKKVAVKTSSKRRSKSKSK